MPTRQDWIEAQRRRMQSQGSSNTFERMKMGMDQPGSGGNAELTAGDYTLRQRLADVISKLYGGNDPKAAQSFGRSGADLASIAPGTGQVLSADDALRAAKQGDTSGAALAALGAIPGIGTEERAAEQAALTFKHPVSGIKMLTPIEHMKPTYEAAGSMLPEKLISPESLYGGHVIPMRGDPTIAGQRLTGVGGKLFEQPVDLHGGPNFARGPQQVAEGAGWASNTSPSTQLANRARTLAESGNPVYGAYMKMSPTSGDYSTMMTHTLNQMFKQSEVDPAALAAFNDAMRAPRGKTKKGWEFPALPDFPGMENLTEDWINNAGKGRTKLAQIMDNRVFRDAGFPEVGVARHATTEPGLLNTPTNTSGFSVVQFDPSGKVLKNPAIPHPTYSQQNVATYKGRTPELPLDVLYGPDYAKGVNPSHLSKILETKPPSVKVDQQTLDRVMQYLRSQDGAKWGLGGAVAAGVLTEEQRREMEKNNAF